MILAIFVTLTNQSTFMDNEKFQLVGRTLAVAAMTPQERERQAHQQALLNTLQSLRITTQTDLPPVQFLFRMLDKPCFPRGELVTVTGKAKSGKTFFLSLLMAACTAEQEVIGISRMPDTPPLKCLWYDTEQSRQSTLEILKERVVPLTGNFPEEMYDVFNTRSMDWDERLELIEAAIAHCQPDFVVIDGICDLVENINDGVSVKPVVERLMQAAQQHDCCIVCAIHQNKGAEDRNPRGWIGTELNNKSFEVYACEVLKPQLIFAVEQTLSRRHRMDRLLYFVVDEQGMPHRSDGPETSATSDSADDGHRKDYPPMNEQYIQWIDNVMSVDIRSLFYDVLKNGARYYTDLQTATMELLGCKDTGYWNNLFLQAKNQRIIVNGKNGQGKSVWMLPPRAVPTELDLLRPTDEAPPY